MLTSLTPPGNVCASGSGDDARDARNWCVGVAVDPVQRMIYWSQKGAPKAGQGRILRAPIDIPSGRTAVDRGDIVTLWAGLPELIDLELTPDRTLVWTDRGAEPKGNTLNQARVKPEMGNPRTLSHGYKEAIGLATKHRTRGARDRFPLGLAMENAPLDSQSPHRGEEFDLA
jgi:hypothetical protein